MERKLKNLWHRLPEQKVGIDDLCKQISEETGYSKTNVKEIFKVFVETINKNVLEGKLVDIRSLGQFFAKINPSRKVVNFNNHKDHLGRTLGVRGQKVDHMQSKATWAFKFRASSSIRNKVKELPPPTEEQIENLYLD